MSYLDRVLIYSEEELSELVSKVNYKNFSIIMDNLHHDFHKLMAAKAFRIKYQFSMEDVMECTERGDIIRKLVRFFEDKYPEYCLNYLANRDLP